MQQYKQVIIKEVDLRKLIDKSSNTISQLSLKTGITRAYIHMVLSGKEIMTEATWNLFKKHL